MPKQKSVLKLPIGVDSQTKEVIDGQSRICNWLYNHLLEKALSLKEEFKQTGALDKAKDLYSKRGLRNLVPSIKKEHPFIKVVHSSPLKNTALRLTDSIAAHQKFRKGKRKRKAGWPKFRSWKKKWFSLFYDEPQKGFRIEEQTLILSLGMGEDKKQRSVSMQLPDAHLLKSYKICNLRIVGEMDHYYAIFTVEKELPETKPISKVIALDPNHKNLAYGVDTEGNAIEIDTAAWLKTYDKRIDELKSKRDRCQAKSKKVTLLDTDGTPTGKEIYLPSRRRSKLDKTLKRALHKRREQTKTFMYTCAHRLFKKYDCVAIGSYTPQGGGITTPMRRAMNNRSLIGRFKEVLSWVAQKSGKTFLEIDEKGSTRTCHHCLSIEEQGIPVSLRTWQCQQCQSVHIRDENAALNILKKVLRDFLQKDKGENPLLVPGSGFSLVKERWAWCVLPRGVIITPRGLGSNAKLQHQEIKLMA